MNNENTTPEAEFNPSNGSYNRAALKRHFKKISEVTRGGKFTRVSEDALNEAEARADARVRAMLTLSISSQIGGSVKASEGLLTGKGKERLVEAFENFLASEMQRMVNDTRTGSTI